MRRHEKHQTMIVPGKQKLGRHAKNQKVHNKATPTTRRRTHRFDRIYPLPLDRSRKFESEIEAPSSCSRRAEEQGTLLELSLWILLLVEMRKKRGGEVHGNFAVNGCLWCVYVSLRAAQAQRISRQNNLAISFAYESIGRAGATHQSHTSE